MLWRNKELYWRTFWRGSSGEGNPRRQESLQRKGQLCHFLTLGKLYSHSRQVVPLFVLFSPWNKTKVYVKEDKKCNWEENCCRHSPGSLCATVVCACFWLVLRILPTSEGSCGMKTWPYPFSELLAASNKVCLGKISGGDLRQHISYIKSRISFCNLLRVWGL